MEITAASEALSKWKLGMFTQAAKVYSEAKSLVTVAAEPKMWWVAEPWWISNGKW